MSGLLIRLEAAADRFSRCLERHRGAFLIGFSALYFPCSIWLVSIKRMWLDELVSYYLSTQAALGTSWAALRIGIDNQPPPFYLITRAATQLGIDAHISVRLPEIIAFWVMSLLLFGYVARRTGALYGAVAMTGPYLCNAYYYACEARPYALVLAFCALSLASWQHACEGRKRRPALVALAFGIAGLVSSHYYAVLVVAALGLAELVRTWYQRRIDWPVWLSVITGSSVVFLYLPFVRGSLNYFSKGGWASLERTSIIEVYLSLFGYSVLPMLALLAAVSAYLLMAPGSQGSRKTSGPAQAIPPQEVAAGLSLLLLPAIGYAVAAAVTNAYVPRYFLAAVIGFGALLAYAAHRWAGGSALFGTAWLAVALGAFLVGGILSSANEYRAVAGRTRVLRALLTGQPDSLPVATDDPLTAASLFQYEKRDLTSRLYYLADPEASIRYGQTPYPQCRNWLERRKIFPVQAEELAAFRKASKRFLLYSTGSRLGYLLGKLVADGAEVRVVATRGSHQLYLVQDLER